MLIVSQQLREEALEQIKKDSNQILQLIQVQLKHLKLPQCPFFEEVLDTQMYGLQKEINFAISIGLIDESDGRFILDFLEKEISALFDNAEILSNN